MSGSIEGNLVNRRIGTPALVPERVLTDPVSLTRCLGFSDMAVGGILNQAATRPVLQFESTYSWGRKRNKRHHIFA